MVKISFLGDISLNNCYNKFYENNINPFRGIEQLLKKSDFNIGNLESLAKGDKGENELKHPRLSTKAKTLNLLKHLNLKVVTLAHNHAYDNLLDGYNKTIEQLKNNNIQFIGAGLSIDEAEKEIILNEKGVKIGLLNFVTSNTNPKMPKNAEVYLSFFEIDKIEKKIKLLKQKVDHVVILLHWGGRVEEGFYPDFIQPVLSRRMINSGADLIIGGHSHTVQPFEIYKGKHIFYSLGNFCFDDIIQDEKVFEIGRYRKRKTIIPTITFLKKTYNVEVLHAKNNDMFIQLNNSFFIKLKMKWRNLIFKLVRNNRSIWNFYFWHLKKIVPIKMYFIEANDGVFKKIINLNFNRVLKYIQK